MSGEYFMVEYSNDGSTQRVTSVARQEIGQEIRKLIQQHHGGPYHHGFIVVKNLKATPTDPVDLMLEFHP